MLDKRNFNKKNGFTLIEMIIVVAMVITLSGLSSIYFASILSANNLDVATQIIITSLHRSQFLSQAVKEDSPWGVKINSGEVVIFKGLSYSLRDPNFDEVSKVPDSITQLGWDEVVYSKMIGLPNITGDLTLLAAGTSDQNIININEKGRLSY